MITINRADELDALLDLYREMFGAIPFGFGYPEPTIEALQNAMQTGEEIEPLPAPDGADV